MVKLKNLNVLSALIVGAFTLSPTIATADANVAPTEIKYTKKECTDYGFVGSKKPAFLTQIQAGYVALNMQAPSYKSHNITSSSLWDKLTAAIGIDDDNKGFIVMARVLKKNANAENEPILVRPIYGAVKDLSEIELTDSVPTNGRVTRFLRFSGDSELTIQYVVYYSENPQSHLFRTAREIAIGFGALTGIGAPILATVTATLATKAKEWDARLTSALTEHASVDTGTVFKLQDILSAEGCDTAVKGASLKITSEDLKVDEKEVTFSTSVVFRPTLFLNSKKVTTDGLADFRGQDKKSILDDFPFEKTVDGKTYSEFDIYLKERTWFRGIQEISANTADKLPALCVEMERHLKTEIGLSLYDRFVVMHWVYLHNPDYFAENKLRSSDCLQGDRKDLLAKMGLGGVLNHLSQITVAASCSMDR